VSIQDLRKRKAEDAKLPNLDIRKDIHLSILRPSHLELKIICMRRNLTIQEVFEEFVTRIITSTPDMIDLLDDLETSKRAKQAHKITNVDAEALYDIIQGG
jgi:hypothetical protein